MVLIFLNHATRSGNWVWNLIHLIPPKLLVSIFLSFVSINRFNSDSALHGESGLNMFWLENIELPTNQVTVNLSQYQS